LSARRLTTVVALALAAAAGGVAACETVDLGAPPADLDACRPGQQYFIDQIWPNFLSKDYTGKHCYDASCHDPGSGRPLTLVQLQPTDVGMIPFSMNWDANYRSATEQMNCANVKASELLERPAGLRTHGGGMLIDPNGPEALLIETWVSQP
jgi:hypothetical protein